MERKLMSEGWICPKCGRALAPWVSVCPCYRTPDMTMHSPGTKIDDISTTMSGTIPENGLEIDTGLSDFMNLLFNGGIQTRDEVKE